MAETEVAQPMNIEEPVVAFKKRGSKAKSNIRKRPATLPPASSDSESVSEDEEGHKIKKRRKDGFAVSAAQTSSNLEGLKATTFEGDRSTTLSNLNDATKQSNWYDEGKDGEMTAEQLLGKRRKQPTAEDPKENDGTYKGQANYSSFIQKNPNAREQKVGPIKAPTNIRTITITDYNPEVCKDYKQTGFCGFGDSCKFLHEREAYAQGWQLDKEWEKAGKKEGQGGTIISSAKKALDGDADKDKEEEEKLKNIPFACVICKENYKSPIQTKCGHYFCEKCALQRYRKTPNCAICGTGTNGVFNSAKDLKRLLERKKEREEKAKTDGESEVAAS